MKRAFQAALHVPTTSRQDYLLRLERKLNANQILIKRARFAVVAPGEAVFEIDTHELVRAERVVDFMERFLRATVRKWRREDANVIYVQVEFGAEKEALALGMRRGSFVLLLSLVVAAAWCAYYYYGLRLVPLSALASAVWICWRAQRQRAEHDHREQGNPYRSFV